jgi:uncharacterized membrane protein (DUF485 family)
MAGLDFKSPEDREQEDAAVVAHNTRIGLILFACYVALYGGFMALSAFSPAMMAKPLFAGANIAVVYGFVLIAAAIVLALFYMQICRKAK